MSTTGAYLETHATPPSTGASLTLLWRAGSKKIQAEALVIWSHSSGALGVRFVDELASAIIRDSRNKR